MRCRQFNLSHSFASIRSLFLLSVCTCIFTPTFQCLWPTMGFEDFPLKLGAQRTICTWAIRQNYLFLLQDDNSDQWNKFLPSITSKLSLFIFFSSNECADRMIFCHKICRTEPQLLIPQGPACFMVHVEFNLGI